MNQNKIFFKNQISNAPSNSGVPWVRQIVTNEYDWIEEHFESETESELNCNLGCLITKDGGLH